MAIYVARQPIFDRKLEVVAYELLYRSNEVNQANVINDEVATARVINNSLLSFGFEQLSSQKKLFINFSRPLLDSDIPTLLPAETAVLEILEDIVPDEAFYERCTELKELGYTLALDDFVLGFKYPELIDYVDIVKVDFMLTSPADRKKIYDVFMHDGVEFLAEKVETKEEYEEALGFGYDYFQGYFFQRPVIMKGQDTQGFSANYMVIMDELNKEEPCFDKIVETIERDINLSYKILRIVNSMAYYRGTEIDSLLQAVTRMGLSEIGKVVTLIVFQNICSEKPDELLVSTLVRGKVLEEISKKTKYKSRKSEVFLLGMFSLIDVMLDRDLEDILEELPLAKDIKDGIMQRDTNLGSMLKTLIAYEKAEWDDFTKFAKEVGNIEKDVPTIYINSVKWANDMLSVL